MGGVFDLKFCNGGDFCMRVRESERGRESVLLGFLEEEMERETHNYVQS